jgi:RNA polymerase sigma factor (sigma-70 family)
LGRKSEFREHYERYFDLILFIAQRFRVPDPESVVQDTFLRFLTAEVRDPAKVKSWLCATARNLCVDVLRRKRELLLTETEFPGEAGSVGEANALAAAGYDPLAELELLLVEDVLRQLAGETGDDTLLLFYSEGHSAATIAGKKGEAVSTVTTRLSRYRKRFGELIRAKVLELRAKHDSIR